MASGLRRRLTGSGLIAWVETLSAISYIAAVTHRAEWGDAIFILSGHTQGRGFDGKLAYVLPASSVRYDQVQTPELGNLLWRQEPSGEAQRLAATAFGAIDSHYSVTGGTGATKAIVDAVTREGEVLILPRNAHSSAYPGLVASGATPHWVYPPPHV